MNPLAAASFGIVVASVLLVARFSITLASIDEPFANEAVYWSEIRGMGGFFLLGTGILSVWLVIVALLFLKVARSAKAFAAACLSICSLFLPGVLWCAAAAIANMKASLALPAPSWSMSPVFDVLGSHLWALVGAGYVSFCSIKAYAVFPAADLIRVPVVTE